MAGNYCWESIVSVMVSLLKLVLRRPIDIRFLLPGSNINRITITITVSNTIAIAMPKRGTGKKTMGGFEEEDGHRNLYQVLGVEKTASQEEIRRAYHKLALQLHPDKNPGDESAKGKFQSLQNVIVILGDPSKRKVYDQTGSVDEAEFSSEKVDSLYEYFQALYKKVTEKVLEDFAASYQGSENETRDLKNLYTKYKGNMNSVFNWLICSEPKRDSHRFKDIVGEAISSGELKEYKVYLDWATQVSKEPRPPNPPMPLPTNKKKNTSEIDVVAMMTQRKQERMCSLASALEAKYGNNGLKKYEEPSEEEFEAARQRVLKKARKKTK